MLPPMLDDGKWAGVEQLCRRGQVWLGFCREEISGEQNVYVHCERPDPKLDNEKLKSQLQH